jgi:predicted ribosomally synthesized six-cysteine peptide SCIFF
MSGRESARRGGREVETVIGPHLFKDKPDCAGCAASCQSACKTSCTVGNQACEPGVAVNRPTGGGRG